MCYNPIGSKYTKSWNVWLSHIKWRFWRKLGGFYVGGIENCDFSIGSWDGGWWKLCETPMKWLYPRKKYVFFYYFFTLFNDFDAFFDTFWCFFTHFVTFWRIFCIFSRSSPTFWHVFIFFTHFFTLFSRKIDEKMKNGLKWVVRRAFWDLISSLSRIFWDESYGVA